MVKLYDRTIALLERVAKMDDNVDPIVFLNTRSEAKDILKGIEEAS